MAGHHGDCRHLATTAVTLLFMTWPVTAASHEGSLVESRLPQLPLPLHLRPAVSALAGKHLGEDAPGPWGQCARDSARVEQAAANRTLWAVRMMDASAQAASGMLYGLRYQLGSFDGCLAAAAASPVGARYCLVSLQPPTKGATTPPGRPAWETVDDLHPDEDVAGVLSGEGMARGALPLGDVRVALCVPRSCSEAALQAALRTALRAAPGHNARAVRVAVMPGSCQDGHGDHGHHGDEGSSLFWGMLAALTALSLASPWLGLPSWDWRLHVAALARPEATVAGLDLSALSGVRSLNAVYLVALHRGLHSARVAASNREYLTSRARARPDLAVLYRGVLGVDTFFFLAGLLLAVGSAGRAQPLGKAMLNRVVRVLPVYALTVLFHCTALPDLGAGPLWAEVAPPMRTACRRWGWSNLLFVNNYVHGGTAEPLCMEHSWSLAVDMHMFVVGTLLLRWLRPGVAGLAALSALSLLAALPLGVATLLAGWPGTVPWTLRTLQGMWAEPLIHQAYTPTHMRAAPYLVGLLAGRALPLLQGAGFRPSRVATLSATALSLAWMLAVMCSSAAFNDLTAPHRPLAAALCAGLAPLAWAVGLAVLVAFTVLGEHTPVRALLSWQPLVTLSRLTFAVYLVSYPLQALLTAAKRDPIRITPLNIVVDSLGDMVISFAVSFWIFLVLEAPLRSVAKRVLSAKRTGNGGKED